MQFQNTGSQKVSQITLKKFANHATNNTGRGIHWQMDFIKLNPREEILLTVHVFQMG